MELNLNELERRAESAGGQEWTLTIDATGDAFLSAENSEYVADVGAVGEDGIVSDYGKFIAAANPAVVLELVRRLREAEEAATLFHAVQHACGELPEGWNIIIDLENGAGFPELYNSEGEKIAWPYGDDGIAQTVIEMVQLAKMQPPKNED